MPKQQKIKRKKVEFTIDEHIFKTSTKFLIGYSGDEFQKKLKSVGGDKDTLGGYVSGTVIPSSKGYFRIVWVEDIKDWGGIIHELSHLVVRICNDKGIPVKANIETGECGDETFAYLMEFYTISVFDKIK